MVMLMISKGINERNQIIMMIMMIRERLKEEKKGERLTNVSDGDDDEDLVQNDGEGVTNASTGAMKHKRQ